MTVLVLVSNVSSIGGDMNGLTILLDAGTNIGISALAALTINVGIGWARWLYGFFYILGASLLVISLYLEPRQFLSAAILMQLAVLVQLILQTSALILMFVRGSREWLRGARVAATSRNA